MNRSQPAPLSTCTALLLSVLLLGGCDLLGDFEEEECWMSVTPSRITVIEGRVVDVVVRTNIGLDVWDMGWGSVDQSVALVDTVEVIGDSRAIAHVHGIGPGSTEIGFGVNAAGNHASASLSVTVTAVTLRSLSLEPDSLTVAPGADFWIAAHAKDSVGWELVGQPVDWQISDSTIVFLQTISDLSWSVRSVTAGNALFRAENPGVVTITASLEGLRSSSVIYVTGP